MSVFEWIPSKTTGIVSGNLIWSSFSRKKEHGYRIQTFWLFWLPHPLNCFLVTKMQYLYLNSGKVLLPDRYSSNTMGTAAWDSFVLTCVEINMKFEFVTSQIGIRFLQICTKSISTPFILYLCSFPPLSIFREEKSEQLLDTRQELENVEMEFRKLQQEVIPRQREPCTLTVHPQKSI